MLKTGPWNKSDLKDIPKNGLKVLSTFSCGGGSSFGYKLAGFEVIGCVEIDPKMYEVYKANHEFKYGFQMGIQEFNKLPDDKIPAELWNLDILDGSPPCSTFSMAGSREKKWGAAHQFREGQAKQHLDDLFFNFIETAKRLQPKVVVAENVKGLIQGNARGYVKQIFQGFKDAGYHCQLFLLSAAAMGVPQARERTFFIANRLGKKINLSFSEKQISISKAFIGLREDSSISLVGKTLEKWNKTKPGNYAKSPNGNTFGFFSKENKDSPCTTQTANARNYHYKYPRLLNAAETIRCQTFPDDFAAKNIHYICGMSVPPFMMQRIADQIHKQLLSNP